MFSVAWECRLRRKCCFREKTQTLILIISFPICSMCFTLSNFKTAICWNFQCKIFRIYYGLKYCILTFKILHTHLDWLYNLKNILFSTVLHVTLKLRILIELSSTTKQSGEEPVPWVILSLQQVVMQCRSTEQFCHNMMH